MTKNRTALFGLNGGPDFSIWKPTRRLAEQYGLAFAIRVAATARVNPGG